MPLLSLAHFTVVEAEPITLIEAAQAGGYDAIGLRIVPLFPTDHVFPVIGNPNLVRSIKRRLMETGIRVLDVEAIWLTAQSDIATLVSARWHKLSLCLPMSNPRMPACWWMRCI